VLNWFLHELPDADLNSHDSINDLVNKAITETNLKGKSFYTPLRLALLGQPHGPDLPTTFMIFGKDELIQRLQRFIELNVD